MILPFTWFEYKKLAYALYTIIKNISGMKLRICAAKYFGISYFTFYPWEYQLLPSRSSHVPLDCWDTSSLVSIFGLTIPLSLTHTPSLHSLTSTRIIFPDCKLCLKPFNGTLLPVEQSTSPFQGIQTAFMAEALPPLPYYSWLHHILKASPKCLPFHKASLSRRVSLLPLFSPSPPHKMGLKHDLHYLHGYLGQFT